MPDLKPKITIDRREPDVICDALESLGAEIHLSQIELGDYVLSDRLIVERKTRSDFEASILDGRLFSQLDSLVASYARVVLIVEGETYESRINRPALLGAYSSVIADFGCALFFTKSPQATAEMVYALAHHEQVAKKRDLPVYAKRKAVTLPQQQRAIIEALPGVGPKMAKELLNYFQTVENVASAPESELLEVAKMGGKRAKQLRELFTKRYKEKD